MNPIQIVVAIIMVAALAGVIGLAFFERCEITGKRRCDCPVCRYG